MKKLSNYNIILGVTGGIAAYKSAYLTRLLIQAGAEVQVLMTEAGARFVTPLTFEALTGREVAVQMFPQGKFVGTRHIDFAEWADLIVIAPATADFIGQIAGGLCPSLLAAVVSATRQKVLFAPAMNDGMWENKSVQKNVATLREYNHEIIDVGVGDMACRSFGAGRMAEPDDIFELVTGLLTTEGPLSNKKVLVTAGPCREAIDPVRYISNRSSGKMGFALARRAARMGGEVTLITGPVTIEDPAGVNVVRIETTDQMARAVEERFPASDYLIMAAAPADYKVSGSSGQKIKKSTEELSLKMIPTVDILKSLVSVRRDTQTVVGFSLETENDIENSQKKLTDKNLDYIIVNNALEEGAGFDCNTNRVTILSPGRESFIIDKADKEVVARKIWEYILGDGGK
ncbi:MAG: bifunctional phosphopantothenoylcysteine decarboxylase/phosphopantothenate--cysteine ligase CoaBC [FCB group bacterium]|nr:bifunctional phosphopantothenoylcysteine decarboxylase/phosphopantothenate--cysteine ligase CoaBC [FCB group bacterium]